MQEILLGVLIGVLLGTISGIIPGIHANTLAGVLLSLQAVLLALLGPLAIASAMFAALITHTFVDAIPSTFLGVRRPIHHSRFSLRMHSAWKERVKRRCGLRPWEAPVP